MLSLGYLGFHQGFWTAILFKDLDVKCDFSAPQTAGFSSVHELDADGKGRMVMNPMVETNKLWQQKKQEIAVKGVEIFIDHQ